MADRYLLESSAIDGYLLEDGTGVLLLEGVTGPVGVSISAIYGNPAKKYEVRSVIFTVPNLLLTTLDDSATYLKRSPVYVRNQRIQNLSVLQPPNLLQTTLAVVTSTDPFFSARIVWPSTPSIPQKLNNIDPPNLLGTALADQYIITGFLESIPQVTKAILPGFINPPNLLTTTLVTTVDPFKPFIDNYNNKKVQLSVPLSLPNLLVTTLAPVPFIPFMEYPVPKKITNYNNQLIPNLLGNTLTPTTNTYTISPSGGITFSGTNEIIHEKVYLPAGTLTFSGTNTIAHIKVYSPSGQIVFSGNAELSSVHVLTPGGTLTFSGAVTTIHERALNPSGSIVFSGDNSLIKIKTLSPTGSITFSSSAALIKINIIEPSGSIVFSGSAPISFIPAGGTPISTWRTLTNAGR